MWIRVLIDNNINIKNRINETKLLLNKMMIIVKLFNVTTNYDIRKFYAILGTSINFR